MLFGLITVSKSFFLTHPSTSWNYYGTAKSFASVSHFIFISHSFQKCCYLFDMVHVNTVLKIKHSFLPKSSDTTVDYLKIDIFY